MRHIALIACALALTLARPARAELNVVATIDTLASFAKEVGGDRVSVKSLSRGTQDPHFVEPKPSLMLMLNRADLLLHVGMELEIGWLPPLMIGSRNGKVQNGEPGNLDCSQAIDPLDVPTTKVDRSMGDIHPQGNPHYWLPPDNARRIAALIAQRLSQLDPAGAATYEARLKDFQKRVAEKEIAWKPMVDKLRGTRVATYHKSWSYVSKWLGLEELGYVEPKPGVPPPPSHLARLILLLRKEKAQLVLMESFYNRAIAQEVAERAGAKLVVLPTDVGAQPELTTWFAVVDAVLNEMVKNLG
jgi:zinc/manganese transport system substrate-binding protein